MRAGIERAAFRSADWLAYFTRNRSRRKPIGWERGVRVSPLVRAPLIHSLQRFQVGEQGDGSHLRKHAASVGNVAYAAAVDLFVQEEQEHSRLLAKLLYALNAELLESHWSDSAFIFIRHLSGLHLEILILLVAEIIAKRYYRMLVEGVDDPVARAIFEQIVCDEQGHVAFHCERLRHDFAALPAAVRAAIRFAWHGAFRVVCLVVMVDHRAILRVLGVQPAAFWRDCSRLFAEAADAVFGR